MRLRTCPIFSRIAGILLKLRWQIAPLHQCACKPSTHGNLSSETQHWLAESTIAAKRGRRCTKYTHTVTNVRDYLPGCSYQVHVVYAAVGRVVAGEPCEPLLRRNVAPEYARVHAIKCTARVAKLERRPGATSSTEACSHGQLLRNHPRGCPSRCSRGE